MSLQVWLPLNGNLNNQGLSEVTVTNSGATVASNGKIGSCYSFDTGKYLTVTKLVALTKEISYSCWVNISSWNSATYDCILSIATGPAWNNSIATLCRNSSNTNLTWNIADGSSRSYVNSIYEAINENIMIVDRDTIVAVAGNLKKKATRVPIE